MTLRRLGTLGGSGFITGLKAKVTVLNADAQACPANPSASQASLQLFASFFSDGSGGPSNATGDILGVLRVQSDSDGAKRLVAGLSRCADDTCRSLPFVALPGNPVTFTTTWTLDTPLILTLVWDQTNGKFTFTVLNPVTLATESREIVYLGTVTDGGPPSTDFKVLRIRNIAENCATGRKRVVMDALLDKIKVQRVP